MKRQRSYGSKQPSRANHRTALLAVLVSRESLDLTEREIEGFARSKGLSVAEVMQAISDERRRRAV